jgi:hypothetical protein
MSLHIAKEQIGLTEQKEAISYSAVKAYAIENGIKSMRLWFQCHDVCKGGIPTPANIPCDPAKFFRLRGEWKSWAEFLETKSQLIGRELISLSISDLLRNDKAITVSQFTAVTMQSSTKASVARNYVNEIEDLLYPKRAVSEQFMRGGL